MSTFTRGGTIRRLDELGRITLPKEMRDRMKLAAGSQVIINGDANAITVYKFTPADDLMGEIDALEAQVERFRDDPDVSRKAICQLTDLIADMRGVLATMAKKDPST